MKRFSILILISILLITLSSCASEPENEINIEPDAVEITSICELATLECQYNNVAKGIKEPGKGLLHTGEVEREFWVEYTGVVRIGVDAKKIKLDVKDDTITIHMPKAKVLDKGIEKLTEDSYVTSEDGWNKNKITVDDQQKAVNEAQDKMEETANKNSSLLQMAENRAKTLIENYINQISKLSGKEYTIKWVEEK